MSLSNILAKVSSRAGYRDVDLNSDIRALLINFINEAATEIWETTDLPGSLRECYVLVNSNVQVALPPFIGLIRAMREHTLEVPWTLNDLRPRYHDTPWPTHWRNWRFIGFSPIAAEITNAAPLTYGIETADASITVTTIGETLTSRRASEDVVLSDTSNVGNQNFILISSIKVNHTPTHNIVIRDASENELAVLYNDQFETRYQIFDVSTYPTRGECPDGRFVMEVLYKMPLPKFYYDADVFPLPDYDDIIAQKAIQLITEGKEGQEDRAILMHTKISTRLRSRIQDQEGVIEKRLRYKPNPLLGKFRSPYGFTRRRNV